MEEQYKIHLPAYDGPLDLLLDLIRRQQIQIYDIPIASITEQYLSYIRVMQELDINVAGEFLLMAATLIYIKSKMLLPKDPLLPEGESEDPRLELVQRLLEHEKFKNAAQMLHQKELVRESSTWTRPGILDLAEVDGEEEIQVTLFDLVSTFQRILERAKAKAFLEIERDDMTVGQVMEKLRSFFERSRGTVSLTEVFSSYRSKRSLIVAFLAVLEMVHLQAIKLFQKETLGEILARRHENFEAVMSDMDHWMGMGSQVLGYKRVKLIEDRKSESVSGQILECLIVRQTNIMSAQPKLEFEGESTHSIMTEAELRPIVEALIYVTEEPITEATLVSLFGKEHQELIREVLATLVERYQSAEYGLEVKQIANGYKMATKAEHHDWVRKYLKHQTPPTKLSLAALETLAVIAYKQPMTVPEIQDIRGVNAVGVLKTLLDKKLITTAGRKNVIGRPILYKTTKEFLVHFGLKNVDELPSLEEFEDLARSAVGVVTEGSAEQTEMEIIQGEVVEQALLLEEGLEISSEVELVESPVEMDSSVSDALTVEIFRHEPGPAAPPTNEDSVETTAVQADEAEPQMESGATEAVGGLADSAESGDSSKQEINQESESQTAKSQ